MSIAFRGALIEGKIKTIIKADRSSDGSLLNIIFHLENQRMLQTSFRFESEDSFPKNYVLALSPASEKNPLQEGMTVEVNVDTDISSNGYWNAEKCSRSGLTGKVRKIWEVERKEIYASPEERLFQQSTEDYNYSI